MSLENEENKIMISFIKSIVFCEMTTFRAIKEVQAFQMILLPLSSGQKTIISIFNPVSN
jgi:hypothetical protein